MTKKRCVLTEKDKQLLEDVRKRRIESESRMKLLNEQIESLRKRVDETNKKMILLL